MAFLLEARSAIGLPVKSVLVLYSNNRLVPGNVEVDHGLSAALASAGEGSVRTYSEFLDSPEFSGDSYENLEVAYLHGKYAAAPPDAIVAVANTALRFIVRHRAQLFPSAPVIYAAVPTSVLQSLQPMPADIIGVPNDYDYSGTISQALQWHPRARHLVIVTGASSQDHANEVRLRDEVPAVIGGQRPNSGQVYPARNFKRDWKPRFGHRRIYDGLFPRMATATCSTRATLPH